MTGLRELVANIIGAMDTREDWPPEGRLLEEARERHGLSQNAAAKEAGMSGTRWRQIVYGEASAGDGVKVPVRGNAKTIARMARAVEVSAQELVDVGRREDAAEELRHLDKRPDGSSLLPSELDPSLVQMLTLWPQMTDWQRGSLVNIAQNMIGDSKAESRAHAPQETERRTG